MFQLDPSHDALSRSLHRVRRGFVLARTADAAFVGIVAGGGAAAIANGLGYAPAGPGIISAVIGFAAMCRPAPTFATAAAWLDARHNLSDLLASAWAVRARQDEPWAATLMSIANARANELPPPGRLARFSARHHACAIAAVVAVWLTTQLTLPGSSAALAATPPATVAESHSATADFRRIAALHQRPGDTVASAAHGPPIDDLKSPRTADGDAAKNRAARKSDPNDSAAGGGGRADIDRTAAPPLRPESSSSVSTTAGIGSAGGSGRASSHLIFGTAADTATGRVLDPAPVEPIARASSNSSPAKPPGGAVSDAAPVPAEYRDVIRDFFER